MAARFNVNLHRKNSVSLNEDVILRRRHSSGKHFSATRTSLRCLAGRSLLRTRTQGSMKLRIGSHILAPQHFIITFSGQQRAIRVHS